MPSTESADMMGWSRGWIIQPANVPGVVSIAAPPQAASNMREEVSRHAEADETGQPPVTVEERARLLGLIGLLDEAEE